jgi:glucokinase
MIPGIFEIVHKEMSEIEVCDVYLLAQTGNAQARQLTDRIVNYIGMGLVNLVNLCSLELVSISGGISNAPYELLLGPLIEFVRNGVYPPIASRVRICESAMGEDAPLIGAALLYRECAD